MGNKVTVIDKQRVIVIGKYNLDPILDDQIGEGILEAREAAKAFATDLLDEGSDFARIEEVMGPYYDGYVAALKANGLAK